MSILFPKLSVELFLIKKENEDFESNGLSRKVEITWPKLLNFENEFWLSKVPAATRGDLLRMCSGSSSFKLPENLRRNDCKTWLATKSEKAKAKGKTNLEEWLSVSSSNNPRLADTAQRPVSAIPKQAGADQRAQHDDTSSVLGQSTTTPMQDSENKTMWLLRSPSLASSSSSQAGSVVGAVPKKVNDQVAMHGGWLSNCDGENGSCQRRFSSVSKSANAELMSQWNSCQTVAAANPWLTTTSSSTPRNSSRLSSACAVKQSTDNTQWLHVESFPCSPALTPEVKTENPWLAKSAGQATILEQATPSSQQVLTDKLRTLSVASSGIMKSASTSSVESWLSNDKMNTESDSHSIVLPKTEQIANWISMEEEAGSNPEAAEEESEGSILTLDTLTEDEDLLAADVDDVAADDYDLSDWLLA